MKRLVTITDATSAMILFLFCYTALSKLADHERFSAVLHSSILLSNYAELVAWTVPVAELIIALLLVIPTTRLTGLYASLGLLTLFTIYILWMMGFAAHLPCNCGGVISKLSWKQHVFFNLFFIALNVLGLFALHKQRQVVNHIQS